MAMNQPHPSDKPFPTLRAGDIEPVAADQAWLVQDLWTCQGVGIIGGAPKCAKSWLGLDLALSVASGSDCLGRFPVRQQGPCLIYLAEDAISDVRVRLDNLCKHRGIELKRLNVHIIHTPVLRLDDAKDRARLALTIASIQPKLLLLDPLVRMHHSDENSSADISNLLGFLREMQRTYQLAIVLVHHMTKRLRSHLGQALRGSSDLHAWGDHNAYLVRKSAELTLTLEHRSAPSIEPLALRLVTTEHKVHLELCSTDTVQPATNMSLREQVLAHMQAHSRPLRRDELRAALRVNNRRLGDALIELRNDGAIVHCELGWQLAGDFQAPSQKHPEP